MHNVVKNVCAKSTDDRLRIDKALGLWKSDNNNKNNNKSNYSARSDWGPLSGPKNQFR